MLDSPFFQTFSQKQPLKILRLRTTSRQSQILQVN